MKSFLTFAATTVVSVESAAFLGKNNKRSLDELLARDEKNSTQGIHQQGPGATAGHAATPVAAAPPKNVGRRAPSPPKAKAKSSDASRPFKTTINENGEMVRDYSSESRAIGGLVVTGKVKEALAPQPSSSSSGSIPYVEHIPTGWDETVWNHPKKQAELKARGPTDEKFQETEYTPIVLTPLEAQRARKNLEAIKAHGPQKDADLGNRWFPEAHRGKMLEAGFAALEKYTKQVRELVSSPQAANMIKAVKGIFCDSANKYKKEALGVFLYNHPLGVNKAFGNLFTGETPYDNTHRMQILLVDGHPAAKAIVKAMVELYPNRAAGEDRRLGIDESGNWIISDKGKSVTDGQFRKFMGHIVPFLP